MERRPGRRRHRGRASTSSLRWVRETALPAPPSPSPPPLAHLRNLWNNARVLGTTPTTPSSEADRARWAAIGRALADPKRLCVLESLAAGELSVGELSARVGCHVPNMSQHLAVLRSAGLVVARREGSTVYYRLADPRVLEAYRLIQSLAR